MFKKGRECTDVPNSNKTPSNFSNETILSPLILDAPNTVLWDHHPCGSPIVVSLSHNKNPAFLIKDRILGLACHFLERMKKDKISCHLIGSVGFAEGNLAEGIRITLNQFEEDKIVLSTIPGDIIAPTVCGWKSNCSLKVETEQYLSDLKYIYHSSSKNLLLDMADFIRIRVLCTFQGIHCTIQAEMVTPATSFKATPVPPIPFIRTSFTKDLAGPKSIQNPQTGFLTIDQNKRLLVLLEQDSRINTLPIVGIWVSGAATVYHPFVWASCVRYISLTSLQNRLCLPPQPFLIAIFSPLHSRPEFYDCITSTGSNWLTFDLYKGKAGTSLAKVPISNSRITTFEMNKMPSKEIAFEEAVRKVSQTMTTKVTSNASVVSNLDDMPQLCPSPQSLKDISVQHLVPDLSLISNNGITDESASNQDHSSPALLYKNEQPVTPLENCRLLTNKSPLQVSCSFPDTEPQSAVNIGCGLYKPNCENIPVYYLSPNTVPEPFHQVNNASSHTSNSPIFEKAILNHGLKHVSELKEDISMSQHGNAASSLVNVSMNKDIVTLGSTSENVPKPIYEQIPPVSDSVPSCPLHVKSLESLERNIEDKNDTFQNKEKKSYQGVTGAKLKETNRKVLEKSDSLRNDTVTDVPKTVERKQKNRTHIVKNSSTQPNIEVTKRVSSEKLKSCLHQPEKPQKQKYCDTKSIHRLTTKKPSKPIQKHVEFKERVQQFGSQTSPVEKPLTVGDCSQTEHKKPSEELPHVYSILQHQDEQLKLLQEKINILLQNQCLRSQGEVIPEISVTKSPISLFTNSSCHPQNSSSNLQEIGPSHISCVQNRNKHCDSATPVPDSENIKQMCCTATMTSFSWPIVLEPRQSSDGIRVNSVHTEKENKLPEVVKLDGVIDKTAHIAQNKKSKDEHTESTKHSESLEKHNNNIQQQQAKCVHETSEKSNSQLASADDSLLSLDGLRIATVCDQMISPAPSIHVDIQDFPASEYSQQNVDSNYAVKSTTIQPKGKLTEDKGNSNFPALETIKDKESAEKETIPDKTFYHNIVGNVNKLLSKQGQQKQSREDSHHTKHNSPGTINRRFSSSDSHYHQNRMRRKEYNFPHSNSSVKQQMQLRRNFNSSYPVSSIILKNQGYGFSETDLSMAVNALATKYFGEEWIPPTHFSRTSECAPVFKHLEDCCIFKTVEVSLKDTSPSDLTLYGISSSNLSFATKRYLEKYGLSDKPFSHCNVFAEDEEAPSTQISLGGDKELETSVHFSEDNLLMEENIVAPQETNVSSEDSLWIFSKSVKHKADGKGLETKDKCFYPSPAESNILDVNVLRQQPKLL